MMLPKTGVKGCKKAVLLPHSHWCDQIGGKSEEKKTKIIFPVRGGGRVQCRGGDEKLQRASQNWRLHHRRGGLEQKTKKGYSKIR